jgi:radical SAM protein with 4Fe4S-binding SPASM domain
VSSRTCYALRDHVAVLADGTVVPCCLDADGRLALGNLFERPLSEMIGSPRAQAMLEGFRRRKVVEPLCRDCGFFVE